MKLIVLFLFFIGNVFAQEILDNSETRYFLTQKEDSLIRVMYFQVGLPLPLITHKGFLVQTIKDNSSLSYKKKVAKNSLIKFRLPAGTPLDLETKWVDKYGKAQIQSIEEDSKAVVLTPKFPEFSFENMENDSSK